MSVEFDKNRALGVNMISGRTVPARGIMVSKDVWADLDGPVKTEDDHISRCEYDPDMLYEDQVVAVSVNGEIRKCLYLFDSYDKIEGKEYVIHPSHNQAGVINIEFYGDREWETSVSMGRSSVDIDNMELYMVADKFLRDVFSEEIVASGI